MKGGYAQDAAKLEEELVRLTGRSAVEACRGAVVEDDLDASTDEPQR